ncbi:unnamed protein product [Closterium sp. NIES-53]
MDVRIGEHFTRFTRRPRSGLYTLTTESTLVAESDQVAASVEVAMSCSCHLLTRQTLLWHHHLGHPSLARLRGMHSCLLVSGLPRSLAPLPRSLAPPCLPCGKGRHRAASQSSSFPPTTAPLLLQSKADVRGVLIRWIRAVRLQLRARFCEDLPVLLLHSDRGGEFCSRLLVDFCGAEGMVARTSMIHAAAPHFLWSFVVRYATEQLNLWPHVSHTEISPTLRWTNPLPPPGAAPSGVSQVDPPPLVEPLEIPTAAGPRAPRHSARLAVPPGFPPRPSSPPLRPVAVDSGSAEGGDTGGADSGGAGSRGAPAGGSGGAGAGGAGARRQETLLPERLCKWAVRWGSPGGSAGHARAAGTGGTGTGGAGAGVPGVGHAKDVGDGGTGATGGIGALVAELVMLELEVLEVLAMHVLVLLVLGGDTGGADTRGATRGTGVGGASRQESLLPQQLREWAVRWGSTGGGAGCTGSGGAIPIGAPGSRGVTAQLEPSPLCHLLSLPHATTEFPIAGTTSRLLLVLPHLFVLVVLPVLVLHLCQALTVWHFVLPLFQSVLSCLVTDPSFESVASALVAELVEFAALFHLDYAASLAFDSSCPPSVRGELALGCDVLENKLFELECLAATAPHLVSTLLCPEGDPDALDIPTPRSYAEAITGPYSSQWQIAMDADMASWKSTGTYVNEVPPHGANIVDGMWIFRVKRPSGSPPAFKARYVARGFSQREGVDFFHTFSPTPKMTTLRVLLHVAAQRDYEWHDTLRTTLAALGFAPTTADPSLFLRTGTSLPLFYVLVYVDDLVFATADTEAQALVKAELQERHTCTDLGELPG